MNGSLFETLIRKYPCRLRNISLSLMVARSLKRFVEVRVMGLAAEMTFFALLSLFPLTGAIAASLGFLERLAGPQNALKAEAAIIRGLQVVFSTETTADVIVPLVQGLLRQEQAGFALGGFLLSLLFVSGIFRSTIETLDTAYRVEERRGALSLWILGMLFALCAIVVTTVILGMVVVGPLLGGARAIANWLGLGFAFEVVWTVARWPVVFSVAAAFLMLLYRAGPNVKKNTWGAFRTYIQGTGLQSPKIDEADDAVIVALHVTGAIMAALLWMWLSSMAVLVGGILNAELICIRRGLTAVERQ
jgi:membrane protein